jgi:hypothetical protein
MGEPYWVTDPRAKGGRLLVRNHEPTPQQKKRAAKLEKEFAMVPLPLATEVAKVTKTRGALVWILLIYTAWKSNSLTFPVSNVMLAHYGVSPDIKLRVLKALEEAKMIKVKWRHKQSPIVTLMWGIAK